MLQSITERSTARSADTEAIYDAAYDLALQTIFTLPKLKRQLAIDTLAWISHAKEPLTTCQLQDALAIEDGAPTIDVECRPDLDMVLTLCAGLVDMERGGSEPRMNLRLIHYTVQDYLERRKNRLFPETEAVITEALITQLSIDDCAFAKVSPADMSFTDQTYLLHSYGRKHWWQHAKSAPSVHNRLVDFLSQPGMHNDHEAFHDVFLLMADSQVRIRHLRDFGTLRHVTETRSNEKTQLLEDWLSCQCSFYLALSQGHNDIARLLLAHGAKAEIP